MRQLLPILFLLVGSATTLAQEPPARRPVRPALLPAGIAGPAGRTGFFANATEGIDAVDLATGRRVWQTREAQKPLFVLNDRLYAQAGLKRNRLRILAFDLTAAGRVDLETDPVVLPRWVVTGPAPGHTFKAHWQPEGKQLILDWAASAWPVRRPGVPDVGLPVRKHASGTARIDLLTGKVTAGPSAARPATAEPARAPRYLEKVHVRWQAITADKHVAVVQEFEPAPGTAPDYPPGFGGETGFGRHGPGGVAERQEVLVLRMWDRRTGKVLAERPLMRGRSLRFGLSLGETAFCVREARPSPDLLSPEAQEKAGQWHLFARNGVPVGALPHVPGTQALAVQGGLAFVLVAGGLTRALPSSPRPDPDLGKPILRPRSVQAFDPDTGEKLWERPVAGKLMLPPGF
jgi:hypothetical protein